MSVRVAKFGAVAVGVFIGLAALWLAVQWFVLGDTECDRGACSAMGEFADRAGWLLPLGWAVIALLIAWAAVLRRSRA